MSDLIDRQAALDALEREKTYCTAFRDGYTPINVFEKYNAGLTDGIKALKKLPSAEVEPVKRGRWIDDNQFHWYRASCSECGYKRVTDIKADNWNGWKYCPNCGARMENEG